MPDQPLNIVRRHLRFAKPVVSRWRHFQSRLKISRLLKERNGFSIELGAGNKPGRGEWITIDMGKSCDIYWDLRKGIPFPTASVRRIYSSHFFEHLSFKETQRFLGECRRVLIPGGNFSICVPNARLYIEAYAKNRPLAAPAYFGYAPAYNSTTRIDYVNYIAYMDGEHKYMFDEENLLFVLSSNGFNNVRLRRFDPSIDLQERDFESLYAEADR
jgi:predicted SAM-dependent methyltransferase